MKFKIQYYDIPHGGGYFAIPEFTKEEIVEVGNEVYKLDKHIKTKRDRHGNPYRKEKSFGFDYISNQGAIKVKQYKEPKIKKI